MTQPWDPDFVQRSPMFEPLRAHAGNLRTPDWPALAALQRLLEARERTVCAGSGVPVSFVPQAPRRTDFESRYEPRIYLKGEVQVRPRNWHDLLNALVWITFPRAKAAINARHYQAMRRPAEAAAPNRGAVRDAMTLFDEGGVIVAARDEALLRLLERFEWKALFWRNRSRVIADMRFYLFGHALYEKALAPFTGITGRGLLFTVHDAFLRAPIAAQLEQLDDRLARRLGDPRALRSTRELAPVPVLGVPGWCADNAQAAYYDDLRYFRPDRRRP